MNILEAGGNFVRQAIEVAVTKKGLDTQKVKGQAAIRLIESADVVPEMKPIPNGNGLGQLTDFYA